MGGIVPVFFPPPFGFDALGPLGGGDAVLNPAPAEQRRRTVGHRRHYLDRFGPGQQLQGAGLPGTPIFVAGGSGCADEGGELAAGPFRDMAGMVDQVHHVAGAETVAETVDQPADDLRVLPRFEPHRRLRRGEGGDDGGGEDRHLDAETDVEAVQLLPKQPMQMIGAAHRPAGADGGAGDGAVGAVERQLEPPYPQMRRREPGAQLVEHLPGGEGDVVGAADGFGESQTHVHRRGRAARRQRLVHPAEGPVETLEHDVAEAGGQRPTGQDRQVADPAQANPAQRLNRPRRQPQSVHRQGG